MDTEVCEAERWELGCFEDSIRNEIVIPNLVKLIESIHPLRILDVGCATGYISRNIQKSLSYYPYWKCLDNNAERISFAEKSKPPQMNVDFIVGDFNIFDFNLHRFDAILFSFTLLDIGLNNNVLSQIQRYIEIGGRVILVLPDAWVDVLKFGLTTPGLSKQFLSESLSLQKIDKFTGSSYPFNVCRLETVISKILQMDFVLEKLDKYESDENSIFLLTFRR